MRQKRAGFSKAHSLTSCGGGRDTHCIYHGAVRSMPGGKDRLLELHYETPTLPPKCLDCYYRIIAMVPMAD